MTVKELIEQLQSLEQDRNIWIFYDYPYAAMKPEIDGQASKEAADNFHAEGVKEGDYFISAS